MEVKYYHSKIDKPKLAGGYDHIEFSEPVKQLLIFDGNLWAFLESGEFYKIELPIRNRFKKFIKKIFRI